MRYTSKPQLLTDIEREHETFVTLVRTIPRSRYKEKGVWGDDWTIHDLLAHLTEWEQMFLRWYREGLDGGAPELPAPGFKWNETPRLNRTIQRKHQRRSIKAVCAAFAASFEEIHTLARLLTRTELFTQGHFPWTKRSALVTYLGANTASHYRTATKILKRWLRNAE